MKALINRKYIPLFATAGVFIILYGIASLLYDGFFSVLVVTNILSDNAYLGVIAIGMTFVILTGGIDLSVGSVFAFATILIASMAEQGYSSELAILLAVVLGLIFGLLQGVLIHTFKMPPFLVTLGGMFFARGAAFMVSMESIGISNDFYDLVLDKANLWISEDVFLPASTVFFLVVFVIALYIAHLTRFGRSIYAIGGSEDSALLMGLPVGIVKVLVYGINGMCSALGGVLYTFFTGSGNPSNGVGLELDVIASVVIGGTPLSGGVGYVVGTLMGVLIYGTIQCALIFDGRLNSWWLRIAIGVLLLLFILMQRVLSKNSESDS